MSASSSATPEYREASEEPRAHAHEHDLQIEEDDDDMDYEPTTETSEDIDYYDIEEDEEEDFQGTDNNLPSIQGLQINSPTKIDAQDRLEDIEFEFTVEGGDDEGEQTETDMPRDRAANGPAGAVRATRSTPPFFDNRPTF
jgi:hypothetical protein